MLAFILYFSKLSSQTTRRQGGTKVNPIKSRETAQPSIALVQLKSMELAQQSRAGSFWNPGQPSNTVIKRWSEAKSFTIFENSVYQSKKILGLPKFFAFFGAKIGALSISLTTEEFCPNYLPFLEPKLEHLLQRNFALIFCLFWSQNRSTYYRGILPKFFAFLEPKSEHLLQRNVAQFFCPSWSQNWSTFYC